MIKFHFEPIYASFKQGKAKKDATVYGANQIGIVNVKTILYVDGVVKYTTVLPGVPRFLLPIFAKLHKSGVGLPEKQELGGVFRETGSIPRRKTFFKEQAIAIAGNIDPNLTALNANDLGSIVKTFLREKVPPVAVAGGPVYTELTRLITEKPPGIEFDVTSFPEAGTFLFIIYNLAQFASKGNSKMTALNLGTLFGPVLFRDIDPVSKEASLKTVSQTRTLTEYLINHASKLTIKMNFVRSSSMPPVKERMSVHGEKGFSVNIVRRVLGKGRPMSIERPASTVPAARARSRSPAPLTPTPSSASTSGSGRSSRTRTRRELTHLRAMLEGNDLTPKSSQSSHRPINPFPRSVPSISVSQKIAYDQVVDEVRKKLDFAEPKPKMVTKNIQTEQIIEEKEKEIVLGFSEISSASFYRGIEKKPMVECGNSPIKFLEEKSKEEAVPVQPKSDPFDSFFRQPTGFASRRPSKASLQDENLNPREMLLSGGMSSSMISGRPSIVAIKGSHLVKNNIDLFEKTAQPSQVLSAGNLRNQHEQENFGRLSAPFRAPGFTLERKISGTYTTANGDRVKIRAHSSSLLRHDSIRENHAEE